MMRMIEMDDDDDNDGWGWWWWWMKKVEKSRKNEGRFLDGDILKEE